MKFNLNMVLAALLGTIFVLMTVSFVSEAIFDPRPPEQEGYVIAVPESDAGGAPAKPEETPIAVLLANADADAGARVFKRCQACHTDTEGGPNKVGPNLWNIVNRPIATHEGFSYSAAMQEFSNGGEKQWTYENLDVFIKAPKKDVPGTAMGFAGLSRDEDRADLIAYLSTMSNDPVPFPEPPAPDETADAGAADGGETGDAAAPADSSEAAPAADDSEATPAADDSASGDADAGPANAESTTAEPADDAEATPPGSADSEQPENSQ
ncbi:c-type cytochrome [uncultured Martelella sp.]|uniref:c-type cytochrome n=1 Tax=uncultured Martelella sp. TaxID=392331 RepID=UPI0029C98D4B|nr:c-type cytochrome [uncultured Martelella sp.]